MTMTDPIADLLTRIRNAAGAQHQTVDVPASNIKREVVRILDEEGYIAGYAVEPSSDGPGQVIRVELKYTEDRRHVITGLRRVSRPGQRHYVDAKHIPKVIGGMGTAIVSTSSGLMTGHDARHRGIGGEVVAEIW